MSTSPVQTPVTTPSFQALGVPDPLVRVLAEHGITEPFPIQSATLPDSLAGRDVLGEHADQRVRDAERLEGRGRDRGRGHEVTPKAGRASCPARV